MHITISAIGRMKSGPERELVARYLDRARAGGRQLGLTGFDIAEFSESRAQRPEQRKSEEAGQLTGTLPDDCFVFVLDERGKSISSEEFAGLISAERDAGRKSTGFIIGGPDGLDRPIRQRANLVLSFSALTWPHQLVRVLLAEQLYRATTIMSGHPYHRA